MRSFSWPKLPADHVVPSLAGRLELTGDDPDPPVAAAPSAARARRGRQTDRAGRRTGRAASGWEALTPTEIKIAALVARGDSTSGNARGMFLSRRTVQTYIFHILTKLGAKGRIEIVREALRQGVSP